MNNNYLITLSDNNGFKIYLSEFSEKNIVWSTFPDRMTFTKDNVNETIITLHSSGEVFKQEEIYNKKLILKSEVFNK